MRFFKGSLGVLGFWSMGAWASPDATGYPQDILDKWASKSVQELVLPDAPPPSRASISSLFGNEYEVNSYFGSLLSERHLPVRLSRVEVVVGDDQLNSSRFQSHLEVLGKTHSVADPIPAALERDFWGASDLAYKSAVKQWGLKQASRSSQGGEVPADWSQADPVQYFAPSKVDFSPEAEAQLRALILAASAQLKAVEGLRNGRVNAKVFSGHHHISTSEGTRIIQPYNYASIYAWVDALTVDGERIYDREQWVVTDAASIESEAVMGRILEMGESVAARAQAPVVQFYEGPVLFEGDAAADFLRYLVSRELMGTPSEPSEDRTYHQMARNGPRIGRRLLPADWTVVDDPNATGVGQYRFDMEGVPAQEVTLVDDGYVRDLVMSRVPRHDRAVSNGHARGAIQGSWSARLSNWRVTPNKNLSERAFYRQVDRVKNAAKTERILVVKGLSGGASLGVLPRPTDAVWRNADGSETPVRTLMFQNVDRRTLRDIAAAGGGSLTRSYLDPFSGRGRSAKASGLPMSVTGPRLILLAEMELVYPGPDEDLHLLPPPALSRDAVSEDATE